MTTQLTTKRTSQILVTILSAVCCGAALAQAPATATKVQYNVSNLASLGGTSSGGNSINDQSWVAGYSRLLNRNRHATLWRNSLLTDLGTLGGPNSSVTWNVKNTAGIIVGISQTLTPEPLGESWSSAAFYSTPNNVGYINLGFVWEQNQMRGLPNFPGGNNGFATGANNLGQVVGWAENGVHDPTCCCTQVLQFRPAMWTLGPPDQIQDLPLFPGDTSGAATAKSWVFQASATRPLEDIRPSTPCFGKTARSLILAHSQLPGGILQRQSINTAISSGLPATRPLLKATSYTLSCGPGRTASDP